ncbi:aminoglycoside phosphotransferase [Labedella phragmitis]|uniref:Aminoglycoside phosphotransferase n=1 Tax=Labedella phragmitis TaxID=2498849 RepID=A0A3S3Z6I3_9MICO|nr:phosphotransferase [Labedella phragmitis]RWZ52897.1 aminoglycoside phosphotransferase [Labedella phragmitis]
MTEGPNDRRIDAALLDERLVRALVAEQFPEWAGLPIRRLERGGNDHRMFRLGHELVVRLPSADDYVPQVAKEQAWLPRLRSQVPLPIPEVRGAGAASAHFPAPWSVYDWIDGTPLAATRPDDPVVFAADLASFLVTLRVAETTDGPIPGLHSAFRGGPVTHWDAEMHDILDLRRELDLDDATWARGRGWAVWKALIMITNEPTEQRALARHVLDELAAGV